MQGVRKMASGVSRFLNECEAEYRQAEIRKRYGIDPSVRWGRGTELYGTGRIEIGERTYFGNDCYLSSYPETASIAVGRCCAIAHNVHIRTSNFRRVPHFEDAFDAPSEWANIVIGNFCWIGVHVYICAGVKIGDNVIIGANSVVTHDIPSNCVVGGVPSRILHNKSAYTRLADNGGQD
jgi:maltose O-acetyltransferase